MYKQIITACTMALLVSGTAAAEKNLFQGSPPLIDEMGRFTAAGNKILSGVAKTTPQDKHITMIICVYTPGKFISLDTIRALGNTLSDVWSKQRPNQQVQWVRHIKKQQDCPAGLVLETYTPPKPTARASVSYVRGDVSMAGNQPLKVGQQLLSGTEVTTGPNGFAALRFAQNVVVDVGPNSKVVLKPEKKGATVGAAYLAGGRIRAKMLGGDATQQFSIETPNAQKGVRGKDFGVAVQDGEQPTSVVEARSGEVTISAQSGPVILKAGSGAKLSGNAAPNAVALSGAPVKLQPIQGTHGLPLTLQWQPVAGATAYWLEIASDVQFAKPVMVKSTGQQAFVLEQLAAGTYFWRVSAVTQDNIVGHPSQLFRVTVK